MIKLIKEINIGEIKMEFYKKWFNELETKELYEILKARTKVFIVNQNIVYQDLDDLDQESLHCILKKDNKIVAYLRAFKKDDRTVKVGRVLSLTHKIGLGKELMLKSIEAIKGKFGCNKIYISSQVQAKGFYEKFGFEVTSQEYMEEGIPHISMELKL